MRIQVKITNGDKRAVAERIKQILMQLGKQVRVTIK